MFLSRIQIFFHPGSRIQDPATTKLVVSPFFQAYISQNRKLFCFWSGTEQFFRDNWQRVKVVFDPTIVTKLLEIRVGNLNPEACIRSSWNKTSLMQSIIQLFLSDREKRLRHSLYQELMWNKINLIQSIIQLSWLAGRSNWVTTCIRRLWNKTNLIQSFIQLPFLAGNWLGNNICVRSSWNKTSLLQSIIQLFCLTGRSDWGTTCIRSSWNKINLIRYNRSLNFLVWQGEATGEQDLSGAHEIKSI